MHGSAYRCYRHRQWIEKADCTGSVGGLQEVRVDQHIEHAQALVVLDKAHATHVCGQIVNRGHAGTRLFAGLEEAQVEDLVVDVVKDLVPLIHGLNINGADSSGEARPEFGNQVSADEAAASGYQDLQSRAELATIPQMKEKMQGFHMNPIFPFGNSVRSMTADLFLPAALAQVMNRQIYLS